MARGIPSKQSCPRLLAENVNYDKRTWGRKWVAALQCPRCCALQTIVVFAIPILSCSWQVESTPDAKMYIGLRIASP